MTSVFPHPPYAEDQPSAHTILYLHVSRASAMAFSFLSLLTAPTSLLLSRYRHATSFTSSTLTLRLLTHASRGLVGGALAGLAMTWGRMHGREDIEWKDRSWRLLENEGEMETDKWSAGGAVVGGLAGAAMLRRGVLPVGFGMGKAVVGGAGVGFGGVGTAYMISSYARWRQPR